MSSNQIHLLFGTLAQKMGQKGLKMGLKCPGLVWYGLACDPGSTQAGLNSKKKIQLPHLGSFKIPPQVPEIRLST